MNDGLEEMRGNSCIFMLNCCTGVAHIFPVTTNENTKCYFAMKPCTIRSQDAGLAVPTAQLIKAGC